MKEEVIKYNKNFFKVSNLRNFIIIMLSPLIIFFYLGIIFQVIKKSNTEANFIKNLFDDTTVTDLFMKGVMLFLFFLVASIIGIFIFLLIAGLPIGLSYMGGYLASVELTVVDAIVVGLVLLFTVAGYMAGLLYVFASVVTYCETSDFFDSLMGEKLKTYLTDTRLWKGLLLWAVLSQVVYTILGLIPVVSTVTAIISPLFFVYSIGYLALFITVSPTDPEGIDKIVRERIEVTERGNHLIDLFEED